MGAGHGGLNIQKQYCTFKSPQLWSLGQVWLRHHWNYCLGPKLRQVKAIWRFWLQIEWGCDWQSCGFAAGQRIKLKTVPICFKKTGAWEWNRSVKINKEASWHTIWPWQWDCMQPQTVFCDLFCVMKVKSCKITENLIEISESVQHAVWYFPRWNN